MTLRPREQHEALQAARRQQETTEWKGEYAMRAGIEGTISQGVRSFGLRRARYRGKAKLDLQNQFIAAACNIKRWLRVLAWDLQQTVSGSSPIDEAMAPIDSVAEPICFDCALLARARCEASACVWRAAPSSCMPDWLIVVTSLRSASTA